jgi:hypothetical protein
MNIIENILSKQVFSNLQAKIMSDATPWYFTESTAFVEDNDIILDASFNHMVFNERPLSPIFDTLMLAFLQCLDKSDQVLEELYRIKIGLITATESNHVHKPHVDFNFQHKTALLYLNTSDGDTIFYNEMENGRPVENFTVKETVSPEENKFVFFDGLQYHSSSTPTKNKRRIVVNFNYR